ncbi:MAG: type II toxin-antitoxin system PemK/MazF family toxin [Candidatus Babeliales bacterium]|nr:type II toxin-antitoxin system PemK/MazF family toxin [Candidatus Babeliales bacterium]
MKKNLKRGDIYWVSFDPTVGTEIKKTRPSLIVSNNASNKMSSRIIVAPITSNTTHLFPFEVEITINTKTGKVLLDQVRSIDKQRLGKYLSTLDQETMDQVDEALKIALSIP